MIIWNTSNISREIPGFVREPPCPHCGFMRYVPMPPTGNKTVVTRAP